MASDCLKIRQKQLKARQSGQIPVYLAHFTLKTGTVADQSQGSWRVVFTWF